MYYEDLFYSLKNALYTNSTNKANNTASNMNESNQQQQQAEPSTSLAVLDKASSLLNNKTDSSYKYLTNIERLYILGKHYPLPINEKELLEDVSSRIWLTYRKNFSQINGDGPDSDQGWGCMIRCGQMLLAETFSRLYLTRNFKWDSSGNTGNPFYWKILSYFRDEKLAPYSIQQIAMMGESEGIQIGKWFGPNAIAQVLNKLTTYEESNHLRFYIAMDNCLFIDEIYESMKQCNKRIKCKKHPKSICQEWSPLLIIIPLRLGLNEFNQDYKQAIKKCLEIEHTVGMIGGKPNQAYYFYGYADDDLLYMDPHHVQPYESKILEDMNDSSYHINTIWKLKFAYLDPSIALAFFCQTETEFLDLIDILRKDVITPGDCHTLFEIIEKRPSFDESNMIDPLESEYDEFVFL